MASRRQTVRTPKIRELFLIALTKGATITEAAQAADMSRQSAYEWRRDDPSFAVDWDEALEAGTDLLEAAVYKRALEGTEKPIFNKLGEVVGSTVEHHDTLAIFMLKARRPEKFKDRVYNEHTGKDGGPIQTEDVSSARDEFISRINAIAERAGLRPINTKLN